MKQLQKINKRKILSNSRKSVMFALFHYFLFLFYFSFFQFQFAFMNYKQQKDVERSPCAKIMQATFRENLIRMSLILLKNVGWRQKS